MSSANRLIWIGALFVGITAAANIQAANQLYRISEVSWSVKAHGNECSAADPSPGPYCGNGAAESSIYSAVGFPQGIQCNAAQPRCPFDSTPTDGSGNFAPLGFYCAPWADWQGKGTTARPAKGMTATGIPPGKFLVPPLYRNPDFFTAGGAPGTTWCTATSTGLTPGGKGRVQAGNPIAGSLLVSGTAGPNGSFVFPAAPATGHSGLRATGVAGELRGFYPYAYSYTYATLRNAAGFFGSWGGAGNFNIAHKQGANTVARTKVTQGAARFGGTMTMLGALTSKHCYYRNGGCSRGTKDWLYDAIGVSVYTGLGTPITQGYAVYGTAKYFNTALGQTSTIDIEGSRFPWTTGSVTVTAVGRGPHKTVHYARGYDNRATTRTGYPYASQVGTLQLVTPVLTRWLQPAVNFETAGIGILRFVPEPRGWAMLAAGLSLLAVGYRMRRPGSAARDRR
ncbi:MAG: hypothetical protein JRE43_03395 [Deltaproteobacteria bacterium]|jgi:hypothetical protein|nr:hypothetical protein [Deltaproteobacteria bacterium]MBW2540869.1 hypothetical protein [Deltaproteobacteria bacterium]